MDTASGPGGVPKEPMRTVFALTTETLRVLRGAGENLVPDKAAPATVLFSLREFLLVLRNPSGLGGCVFLPFSPFPWFLLLSHSPPEQ